MAEEAMAEVAAAIVDGGLEEAAADATGAVADVEVVAATAAAAVADHGSSRPAFKRRALPVSFCSARSALICVQLQLCLPDFFASLPSGC